MKSLRTINGSIQSLSLSKRRLLWISVSMALAFANSADAANLNYYWDTGNGTWSAGASWSNNATSGGTNAAPGQTDTTSTVTFNQSTVNGTETVSLSQNQSIGTMVFNNSGNTTLQSLTSTTETLTLGTGGITVNSSSGSVTLGNSADQVNLTLGGSQTWTNGSTSTLTILGNVTGSVASTLTIAGSGGTAISGNISNAGTGTNTTLTDNSTGTVTLSGSNSYSGATTINSGTFSLTGTMTGGGAVSTATTGVFSESSTGSISGATVFTQGSSGTSTLGGNNTYTGSTTVSAGDLNLTGTLSGTAITLTATGTGSFTEGATGVIAGASSFTQSDATTTTLGNVNTYTGATTANAGEIIFTGTLTADSTITTSGLGYINQTSSALDLTGGMSLTNSSTSAVNTVAGLNLFTGGKVIVEGGDLSLTGTLNGTPALVLGAGNIATGSVTESNTGVYTDDVSTGVLQQQGTGFSNLAGANTYTGITYLESGEIQADFTGLASGAQGRIGSSSVLDIGGSGNALETFSVLGSNVSGASETQIFGGLTLYRWGSTNINVANGTGNTTGTTTLQFGGVNTFTINGSTFGSTINFNLGSNAQVLVGASAGGFNYTSILANDITLNNTDWASGQTYGYQGNAAGALTTPLSAFTGYAVSTATTTAPGVGNVDVQASNTTAWSSQQVNTLRFNTAGTDTLTIGSGQALIDNAGGLMVTGNVGAHNIVITGGTLTDGLGAILTGSGSTTDFIIDQFNTGGTLTINSTIADYYPYVSPEGFNVTGNNTYTTALTKAGAGALLLNGANTYSGATYVDSGTLVLGSSSTISNGVIASGPVGAGLLNIASGAEVDDNGASIKVANSVTVTGSVTFGSTGSGTLTFGPNGGSLLSPSTFTAVQPPSGTAEVTGITVNNTTIINDSISMAAGLALSGSGTLEIVAPSYQSNINSNSLGVITVNSGALELGSTYALGNTNTVTLNSNNGLIFASGVGTFDIGGLSGSASDVLNDVTGSTGVTLAIGFNNTGSTYAGNLSGLGGLTKVGTGGIILTGSNTYSGNTTVRLGTLTVGNSTSTGWINSTGTLVLGGNGSFTLSTSGTNTSTFSGGLLVTAGNATVTDSVAGDTLAFGYVTQTTGGIVDFALTGPATTTSSNVNGILGPWALSGSGTSLRYATVSSNTITAYTSSAAGTNLVNVTTGTGNYTTTGTTNVAGSNLTGNTLQVGATAAGTITLGTNTLTVNGLMNDGSGLLTVTGGSLAVGSNGELDLVSNTQGMAIASNITGTGNVVYGGPSAGALTLSGSNSFTGSLYFNPTSTLSLQNSYALAGSTGLIINGGAASTETLTLLTNGTGTTTSSSGTITFTQGGSSTAASLTLNGASTTISVGDNNSGTSTGNLEVLGATTIGTPGGAATLNVIGANSYNLSLGSLTLTGNVTLQPSTASLTAGTVTGSGWNLTLGGSSTGTDTVGAIQTGVGSLTINTGSVTEGWIINGSGSNYSGATTISVGTLSDGIAGAYSGNSEFILGNNSAVDALKVNFNETIGSLSGGGASGGNVTITGTSTTLTIGNDNTNETYSGAILGTGNLTKIGTGTQTLGTASTYTGTTTITGGILSAATLQNGGVASALGASSNAAANLVINGGTLQLLASGTASTTDRLFTIGANGATIDDSQASGVGGVWFTNTNTLVANNNASTGTTTLTLTGSRWMTNNANSYGYYDYNLLDSAIVNPTSGGGVTSLVKNGPGMWVIGGNNTYTGSTTVNEGILEVQTPESLGAYTQYPGSSTLTLIQNSPYVASGAALVLNYGGTSIGQQILGSSDPNAGSQNEFNSYTLSAFLNGNTTFGTGSNTGNFQPGSTLGIDPSDLSGSYGLATYGGGVSTATNTALSYSGTIALPTGVSFGVYDNTGNTTNNWQLTLTGPINLSGTGGITINSSINPGSSPHLLNITELQGADTYSGPTTLAGGALVLGNTAALGSTSEILVTNIGMSTSNSYSLDEIGVDQNASLTSVTNPFVISAPVVFQPNGQLGNNPLQLLIGYSTAVPTGSYTYMAGSGDLAFTGAITGSNPSSGAVGVSISGGPQLFTVLTTFDGPIYISNGGAGSGSENFNINVNNPVDINNVIQDTASGSLSGVQGNLSIGNNDTYIYLNGANTYTGLTDIYRGSVFVTSINSTGTAQMASSSLGDPSSVQNGIIDIGNGGLIPLVDTGVGETSNRGIGLVGVTTAGEGGIIQNDSAGALVLTGSITNLGEASAISDIISLAGFNTEANTVSGVISDYTGSLALPGSASTSLEKGFYYADNSGAQGSGVWTLTGANTYTGATLVADGTLVLANANALGNTGGVSTLNSVPSGANSGAVDIGAYPAIGNFNAMTGTYSEYSVQGYEQHAALDLNGNSVSKAVSLFGGMLVNNNTTTASTFGMSSAAGTGISSVMLTGMGSGVSAGTTVNFSGGGGSGASAVALLGLTNGALSVVNGGAGITSATIAFTAPAGGTAATGSVTISGGAITGITILTPGSGYTTAPIFGAASGGYTLALNGNGVNVTTAPLLSASSSSFEVVGITLTNGGSGYTSLPTVALSSGTGDTATAQGASLDLADNSSIGGAGNLTINPGITSNYYNSSDVLAVGAFGITKVGTGTTVLNGNSTYTGGTTVNAGVLQLNPSGSLSSSSALTMGGGTFLLEGTGTSNVTQTMASLATSTTLPSQSTISIANTGTTSLTTLAITNNAVSVGTNGALNINYNETGGTNGGTIGNNLVAYTGTFALTDGILSPLWTVTDASGLTGYATLFGGATTAGPDVIRINNTAGTNTLTALPTSGGSSIINYYVSSNGGTNTAGSLTETLTGAETVYTLTADTTLAATGGDDLNLGASKLIVDGGLLFTGANPYSILPGTTGSITPGATMVVQNYNTSSSGVTISAPITGGQAMTFAGTGITNLSGTNSITGAINLLGGTLNLASAGALGGNNALNLYGGTISNTGTAALTSSGSGEIYNSFTFGAAGQTSANNLTFSGGATFTSPFAQTITLLGNGTTLKLGSTWSNSGDYAQTLTVNGAGNTLALGGMALDTNFSSNMYTIAGSGNVTVNGVISNGNAGSSGLGAESLVYAGTGTLTLNGLNTYGGGLVSSIGAPTTEGMTVVEQGTVIAGTSALQGTLASSTATETVYTGTLVGGTSGAFGDSNTTVSLGGSGSAFTGTAAILAESGVTIGRSISEEQTTTPSNSALILGSYGTGTATGTATFTGTITADATTTLVASPNIVADFNTGTFTTETGTIITNNNLFNIGIAGDTGTVQLDEALNTTAGIDLNYGTLAVNSNSSVSPVTMAANTTLTNNTGTGTVGNVTLAGNDTLSSTGSELVASSFAVTGTANTVSTGTISGPVTFSTSSLTPASLSLGNGVDVAGTVNVSSYATLSTLGNAATTGVVTLGGTQSTINMVKTAATTGTLTVGGLTTTGGGTMDFAIGTSLGSLDNIVDTGSLSLAGTTTVNIANLNNVATETLTSGTYQLISYTGTQQPLSDLSLGTPVLDKDQLTLSQASDIISLNVATITTGTYTLNTSAAATALHVGGSTALTSTLTNTGGGSISTTEGDSINATGLGASASGGSVTGTTVSSSSAIGQGGTLVNPSGTQTFTASMAGSYTVTGTVTSATNANIGGTATLTGDTGVTIKVFNLATTSGYTIPSSTINVGAYHTGGTATYTTYTATITNGAPSWHLLRKP